LEDPRSKVLAMICVPLLFSFLMDESCAEGGF